MSRSPAVQKSRKMFHPALKKWAQDQIVDHGVPVSEISQQTGLKVRILNIWKNKRLKEQGREIRKFPQYKTYNEEIKMKVVDYLNMMMPMTEIARALVIPVETIRRWEKYFRNDRTREPSQRSQRDEIRRHGYTYRPPKAELSRERMFKPDALMSMSRVLMMNSKITINELRDNLIFLKAIPEYEELPDMVTIHNLMRQIGFNFGSVKKEDKRVKGSERVVYEKCMFAAAQKSGMNSDYHRQYLDPFRLWFVDESNFFLAEQPSKAWGVLGRPANLKQPKGKTTRVNMMATIGLEADDALNDEYRLFLHWTVIPPQKQNSVFDKFYKDYIKIDINSLFDFDFYQAKFETMFLEDLKHIANRLLVVPKTESKKKQDYIDMLNEIQRKRNLTGQMIKRGVGSEFTGGSTTPFLGSVRSFTEYLTRVRNFYFYNELSFGQNLNCSGAKDSGITGCPEGGQWKPPANWSENRDMDSITQIKNDQLKKIRIVMDNASTHLPSQPKIISEGETKTNTHRIYRSILDAWVKKNLNMAGIVYTPPYTPTVNPVELLFSYFKGFMRKKSPTTVKDLIINLRETTKRITPKIMEGWLHKSGYDVRGYKKRVRRALTYRPMSKEMIDTIGRNSSTEGNEASPPAEIDPDRKDPDLQTESQSGSQSADPEPPFASAIYYPKSDHQLMHTRKMELRNARCFLPRDFDFGQNKEYLLDHIVCMNEKGIIKRFKKRGESSWKIYRPVFRAEKITNVSVATAYTFDYLFGSGRDDRCSLPNNHRFNDPGDAEDEIRCVTEGDGFLSKYKQGQSDTWTVINRPDWNGTEIITKNIMGAEGPSDLDPLVEELPTEDITVSVGPKTRCPFPRHGSYRWTGIEDVIDPASIKAAVTKRLGNEKKNIKFINRDLSKTRDLYDFYDFEESGSYDAEGITRINGMFAQVLWKGYNDSTWIYWPEPDVMSEALLADLRIVTWSSSVGDFVYFIVRERDQNGKMTTRHGKGIVTQIASEGKKADIFEVKTKNTEIFKKLKPLFHKGKKYISYDRNIGQARYIWIEKSSIVLFAKPTSNSNEFKVDETLVSAFEQVRKKKETYLPPLKTIQDIKPKLATITSIRGDDNYILYNHEGQLYLGEDVQLGSNEVSYTDPDSGKKYKSDLNAVYYSTDILDEEYKTRQKQLAQLLSQQT